MMGESVSMERVTQHGATELRPKATRETTYNPLAESFHLRRQVLLCRTDVSSLGCGRAVVSQRMLGKAAQRMSLKGDNMGEGAAQARRTEVMSDG